MAEILGLVCSISSILEAVRNAVDIVWVHSTHGKDSTAQEELYSKLFPEGQRSPHVLTYGYDHSLWKTKSGTGYEDVARELLLELERANFKLARPLIFLCHSLGGIIAKKALLLATDDQRTTLRWRTRGFIFLGPQHENFSEILLEKSSDVANTWTNKQLSNFVSSCKTVSTIFERECSRYEIACFSYDGMPDNRNRKVSRQKCVWSSLSGTHMIGKNQSHYTLPETSSSEFFRDQTQNFIDRVTGRFLKGQEASMTCFKRQEEVVQKYASQRMPGTSNWIFDHPSYQAWLDPYGASCLWIIGAAGAGKSTLCTAILDNLKHHQQLQPSTYISCFSNTDNVATDSAKDVLRILIYQLIEYYKPTTNVSMLLSLLDNLERHVQKVPQASFKHYLSKMFNALSEKRNIIFVFDDFDINEWIKPTLIDVIIKANHHRSEAGCLKCLFASRSSFISTESSNHLAFIDMSNEPGVYSDMFHYAVKNVMVLPSISFEHSHVLEVSHRLCHRAAGIFLWVVLALEDLQGSCEPLETVENIPHGIAGIYERRLASIASEDWPVAQKILSWLAVAYRSLSLSELSEALVIENQNIASLSPQASDHPKNEQQFSETEIYRICGSLVRVTGEDIVTFRHSSVRRYLVSGTGTLSSKYGAQNPHELVAKACLVLMGSVDEESFSLLSQDPSHMISNIPQPAAGLIKYVATYWAPHVRLVERKSRSVNTMLQYLFERTLKRSYQRCSIPERSWRTQIMKTGLLQLFAYHGFTALTQMYLESGVDPNNIPCTSCDTPLHIAVAKGNTECVALLLKSGACINESTNHTGGNLLHVACSIGSLSIAKMILRSDPNTCHTTDLFGYTPLHFAVACGNVELLNLLLDYGADYNATTTATYETPLHLAAGHGHHQAVIALVDGRNAFSPAVDVYDSITQQTYFKTWSEDLVQDNGENGPFVWDSDARHLADTDIKSLLSATTQYADPSKRNYEGRTALQEAALCGHETVVQVLLGGDEEFTGGRKDQVYALQLAAEHGHLSVVELLLKRGVYAYSGSREWGALIEKAANNGHQAVANLLMWQAFGSEIGGSAFKWPTVSLATRSRRVPVQEILHRKRMQRGMRNSTVKRSGSGAGTGGRQPSYRLPFRSRNS